MSYNLFRGETMKKTIFLLFIIVLMSFNNVYAVPGCCSWHGGEVGCSGRKTLCADGTISTCPCDGTSSYHNYNTNDNNYNHNYNYNNIENNNPFLYIILSVILGGVIVLSLGFFANLFENSRKKRQKVNMERYRLKQEEEEKRIEFNKESTLGYIIENNDYIIKTYISNINVQILNKFKSDDLIKLVSLKNENIFVLFDAIYENEYGRNKEHIFDYFAETILNYKTLNVFQKKCLKYIIENNYINKYNVIFLLSLKNKHIELIKYILNNCNKIDFSFSSSEERDLFNYLLHINDLKLTEKISRKKNFNINVSESMLYYSENVNVENKYKILSILSKNNNFSYLNIGNYIDSIIDLNDKNSILTNVNEFSKMNDFLEENGYHIIFLLIRKQNFECIKNILSKYRNINLNQRFKCIEKNYDGLTPLIYACYKKSSKIVKLLLDYGVDINYGDVNGNTALEYACCMRNLNIAKLLYDSGARLKEEKDNFYIENAFSKKDSFLLCMTSVVYIPKLYKLQNRKK